VEAVFRVVVHSTALDLASAPSTSPQQNRKSKKHQRTSASLFGVEALEGVLDVLVLNQINTFVGPARIPQLVNTKVICEQADGMVVVAEYEFSARSTETGRMIISSLSGGWKQKTARSSYCGRRLTQSSRVELCSKMAWRISKPKRASNSTGNE
jgi:hypothetical protein